MQLVNDLHDHLGQWGYLNLQVPAFADLDLLLTKIGDHKISGLLTIDHGGRAYGLRSEFTALAAHHYAQVYPHGDEVVRWQFHGSIFWDVSASSNFQQMSVGAELIGSHHPFLDAEIMALAFTGLKDVAANSRRASTHRAYGSVTAASKIIHGRSTDGTVYPAPFR